MSLADGVFGSTNGFVKKDHLTTEPYARKFATKRVERWQSGLTRTPGKREYPKGIGGSNPPLSARFHMPARTKVSASFFVFVKKSSACKTYAYVLNPQIAPS